MIPNRQKSFIMITKNFYYSHKYKMKKTITILCGILLMTACGTQQQETTADPSPGPRSPSSLNIEQESDLASDQQRLSYALGAYFGEQLVLFDNLDLDVFFIGLQHAYANETQVVLSERQIGQIIVEGQQTAIASAGEQALEEGNAFLEENAKTEDVVVLDNGIQYQILTEGQGAKPKVTDMVEVHYEGRLVNGEVFDSSYTRNETAVFPLEGVIAGWQEILPLMPTGSIWQVAIPPDLAYGERGSGRIGPNAVLIFKIELIDIKEP